MSEVYKSIAAIQGALAKTGIAKTRKNSQGSGYMFRGIDDVYSALSPLLSANELCIIPRLLEREVVERAARSGGALFYITVKAEFDFVSAKDGSTHTACTYGEAMDSGDKATNKAMSAAYKYAAFMTFAIPTEGDNDADAATHDVAARDAANDRINNPVPHEKKVKAEPLAGPYTSKSALWTAVRKFTHELNGCGDSDMLEAFLADKDSLALLAQCERDAPNLLRDSEIPDYVPLDDLIAKMRADFELIENNTLRAG